MGSFGELFGVSWELFEASKSTTSAFELRFGTLLGLLCSFLAADDGQESVNFVFYLLFEPLGVLLGPLGVDLFASSGFDANAEIDFKRLRFTMLAYAPHRAAHGFDHDHCHTHDDDDYLLLERSLQ